MMLTNSQPLRQQGNAWYLDNMEVLYLVLLGIMLKCLAYSDPWPIILAASTVISGFVLSYVIIIGGGALVWMHVEFV